MYNQSYTISLPNSVSKHGKSFNLIKSRLSYAPKIFSIVTGSLIGKILFTSTLTFDVIKNHLTVKILGFSRRYLNMIANHLNNAVISTLDLTVLDIQNAVGYYQFVLRLLGNLDNNLRVLKQT